MTTVTAVPAPTSPPHEGSTTECAAWYLAATRPRSIAIVGASSTATLNHYQNHLVEYGFSGSIHPVNPKHSGIQGLNAFASVKDIPGQVDLAIITVPARAVPDAVSDCVAAGVPVAFIGSAGFSETGEQGAELEDQVMAAAGGRIRLLGPNGNGIINLSHGMVCAALDSIQTSIAGTTRDDGIGLVSQSGIIAASAFLQAQRAGLGIAKYFSVGNEMDVDLAEVVEQLVLDETVRTIVVYIEGLTDGEAFRRAARRAAAAGKPIVALKVGVTELGAEAAASHTASVAGSDRVYDGILREEGVIRAESLVHLLDITRLLAAGVRPRGRRGTILSISGAHAVMLTDMFEEYGLTLADWSLAARERLVEQVPAYMNVKNPFDGGGPMLRDRDLLETILSAGGNNEATDFVIVAFAALPDSEARVAKEIARLRRHLELPTVAVWMAAMGTGLDVLNRAGIPALPEIERAMAALVSVIDHEERAAASRELSEPVTVEVAESVIERAVAHGQRALDEVDGKRLLAHAGIPVVREERVSTPAEAENAAARLGWPVAAKLLSAELQHKSDVGAVSLGISTPGEAARECERLMALGSALGLTDAQVVMQEQVSLGVELLLGLHNDATFGRVVTLGLGGVLTEALRDIQVRSVGLCRQDILDMVRRLRHQRLIRGFRGAAAIDEDMLVDVVLRFAALARQLPEVVTELEINPLGLSRDGSRLVAVDALVALAESPA